MIRLVAIVTLCVCFAPFRIIAFQIIACEVL
jgi:hypothetical protein